MTEPQLNSDQRQQILAALQNGQKIHAIKLYRNFTGTGLREAKRFVETLISTLKTGELPGAVSGGTGPIEHRIIELLVEGKKIPAIKEYREAHGCGLKEAKDAVENIQRELGDTVPQGSGCGAAILLAAVPVVGWLLS